MPHRHAEPAPPGTAPLRNGRGVGLRCDDLAAGRAWALMLSTEGLQVHVQAIDDRTPTAGDALVLHLCGPLAEQLGRLRALREQAPRAALLVVVPELRDLDQVLGLEMGADDVVDARTAASVVAARLRALWRRGAAQIDAEPAHELRFGRLELLRLQREARLAGSLLPLTEGEFEVLWLLAAHAGHALSRHELLRRVRGLDDCLPNRSIDSRVYRIRAKLGDGVAAAQRIRTVRNHGYVFCPTGW